MSFLAKLKYVKADDEVLRQEKEDEVVRRIAQHDILEKSEEFVYDAATAVKNLWIKTTGEQMSTKEFERLRDTFTKFFSEERLKARLTLTFKKAKK
jgi:hypothetical protein